MSPASPPLTSVQLEDAVRLYENGHSVKSVARTFRVRTSVISDLLNERNVRLHPGGRQHPSLTPIQQRELAAAYQDGASLADLVQKFEVSKTTIRNVLAKHGVETNPPGRPEFWTPEVLQYLRDSTAAGISQSEMAKHLGLSQTAVSRRMQHIGLLPAAKRNRGKDHGSWKGGRSITEYGYVLVLPEKEDLRYATVNVSGYVLEHRLMVGKALGRKLLRSETVHHINGDKTDNRLENLQVRRGNHGNGAAFQCQSCGSHDIIAVPLAD